MPNRIIKESIRTSEDVNRMSDFQFRLWVSLITYVDDYGRGDARAQIIKSACFPLRERITIKDIDAALKALAGIGFVSLYEVDGKPYLYFPTWESHQKIRSKRSKYPAPLENQDLQTHVDNLPTYVDNLQTDVDNLQTYVPVIQSNPNPNPNPNPNRAEYSASAALNDAILSFVEFRKKSKKPMTDKAVELMIKKLNELSNREDEQIAILNQSILNGWTGIYELKGGDGRGNGKSHGMAGEETSSEWNIHYDV